MKVIITWSSLNDINASVLQSLLWPQYLMITLILIWQGWLWLMPFKVNVAPKCLNSNFSKRVWTGPTCFWLPMWVLLHWVVTGVTKGDWNSTRNTHYFARDGNNYSNKKMSLALHSWLQVKVLQKNSISWSRLRATGILLQVIKQEPRRWWSVHLFTQHTCAWCVSVGERHLLFLLKKLSCTPFVLGSSTFCHWLQWILLKQATMGPGRVAFIAQSLS